ncbi:hypothetical protein HY570_03240 [Candidatus Micrarchaeota archaeon]|nr:hypothetical protein [Candidatus Micrarchaeota archaeon]
MRLFRQNNGRKEGKPSAFEKLAVLVDRLTPVWVKERKLLNKVKEYANDARKWRTVGYHERAGDYYKRIAEVFGELSVLTKKNRYDELRMNNLFKSCHNYWLEAAERISLEVLEKLIQGYESLGDSRNVSIFRANVDTLTREIENAEVAVEVELGRLKQKIFEELYEGRPERAYEIALEVMELAKANSIDVEENNKWLLNQFQRAPDLVVNFGERYYRWRSKQIKKFFAMLMDEIKD